MHANRVELNQTVLIKSHSSIQRLASIESAQITSIVCVIDSNSKSILNYVWKVVKIGKERVRLKVLVNPNLARSSFGNARDFGRVVCLMDRRIQISVVSLARDTQLVVSLFQIIATYVRELVGRLMVQCLTGKLTYR